MKVLSVILTVALAFSCVTPIYATSTGSALTFDDQWLFDAAGIKPIEQASLDAAELKAAAASPSGTQTDPIYVRQSIGDTTVDWFFIDSDGEEDDVYENVHGYYSGYEGLSWSIVRSLKNLNDYLWYHQTENDDGTTSEAGLLLIERNLLGAYVALLEMQPNVSGILSGIATSNSRLNTVISDIVSGNNLMSSAFSLSYTSSALAKYRQQYDGGSSLDANQTLSTRNAISNLWLYLANLNQSSVFAFRDLVGSVGSPAVLEWYDKDLNSSNLGRYSFWRDFRVLGTNINNLVARIGYVIASDDEIAARAQAASNQAAIVDDFVKPTGSGSISVSDIGDMADLSDSMKDTFSSNVDPLIIFDGVGSNSHAWDWFSNDVKNSLAYNPSRGSYQLRSTPGDGSSTPYLDAYYRDVQEALGVNLW